MLSKPIRPLSEEVLQNIENVFIDNQSAFENVEPTTPLRITINPIDFFNKKHNLDKYKVQELRAIIRDCKSQVDFKLKGEYTTATMKRIKPHYDFGISGSKTVMIERINHYFAKYAKSVIIQKMIRGNFVRLSIKLRGPAYRKPELCVNQSDFFTLEPLNEINHSHFFSFKTKDGFIYGFDINSLLTMIKNKGRNIINPYNREKMNGIIPNIYALAYLIDIIYPNWSSNEHIKMVPPSATPVRAIRHRPPIVRAINHNPNQNHNQNQNQNQNQNLNPDQNQNLNENENIVAVENNYNTEQMRLKLQELKNKTFNERVLALFLEIDQMGHYTQPIWFMSLERRDYVRYFRVLFDIWRFRAQLSYDTKRKICPLGDPFLNILRNSYSEISLEHIQEGCITIMEHMVHTGIDNDFRMLGSFHVLSALTVVSIPARTNMMWLYESVIY